MRALSFRPSLTFRGRKFKGLRGWAGKPLHPPLTDIPVGAYILVAVFDLISFLGQDREWSRDFYRAGTFALVGGVALLAAVTGFWDWLKSAEKGTQARRTVNAHAWTMVALTVVVLVAVALRTFVYDDDATPGRSRSLSAWWWLPSPPWERPSGGPSYTTTASTSRPRATTRCGTSPTGTSSPASTSEPMKAHEHRAIGE